MLSGDLSTAVKLDVKQFFGSVTSRTPQSLPPRPAAQDQVPRLGDGHGPCRRAVLGFRQGMARQFKIIVEKHSDGYVAYPLGMMGVVVGEGDSYEEALADVKSAIRFHI